MQQNLADSLIFNSNLTLSDTGHQISAPQSKTVADTTFTTERLSTLLPGEKAQPKA